MKDEKIVPDKIIAFRPGLPDDLAAVRQISKDVWNGHDYLPNVWEKWLVDSAIKVFVLEIDNSLAGVYALELLSDAGWWQGVRVATAFRGQGLALKMLEHALAETQRQGLSFLRFATGDDNTTMHRLAARHNFRYLAPYNYFRARPLPLLPNEPPLDVRPLAPTEFELGWQFIQNAPDWQRAAALHCDLWVWKKLTPSALQEWLAKGWVYGCFDANRLAALALIHSEIEEDNRWVFVTWLDGEIEAIRRLAYYLWVVASREFAPKQEFVLDSLLLRDAQRDPLLSELGWQLETNDGMRLYERVL